MIVKRVLGVMSIALLLQHTPSADHKQSKGLLLCNSLHTTLHQHIIKTLPYFKVLKFVNFAL